MTIDYAENRIKEALRLSGGNVSQARRQIQAWLYEDHKLVLSLTRPHLNGIIAYAVDRVLNAQLRGEDDSDTDAAEQAETVAKAKAAAASKRRSDAIGREILKSFAAQDTARFGHENSAPPTQRKAASQAHVDAIHLMAAKSRQKNRS